MSELKIEVDLDKFELEDLEVLDGSKEGNNMRTVLDTLDRLVVGGVRGRGFGGLKLPEIQKVVLDAITSQMNPSTNGKKLEWRLTNYLYTKTGEPPLEYVKYQLRTMYNCTPKELDEQKGKYFFEMMQDLKCQRIEAKAMEANRRLATPKRGKRG